MSVVGRKVRGRKNKGGEKGKCGGMSGWKMQHTHINRSRRLESTG